MNRNRAHRLRWNRPWHRGLNSSVVIHYPTFRHHRRSRSRYLMKALDFFSFHF